MTKLMKISNQFTEQNHKGFIEIFQFQIFQLCPRQVWGNRMKGAGARDRVCPRTGVQRWLRVNSNASLPGAQWSTLYPCMRGQQHGGGRGGGRGRRDGGHTRTRERRGQRTGWAQPVCDMTSVIFVVNLGFPHLRHVWAAFDAQHTGKRAAPSRHGNHGRGENVSVQKGCNTKLRNLRASKSHKVSANTPKIPPR